MSGFAGSSRPYLLRQLIEPHASRIVATTLCVWIAGLAPGPRGQRCLEFRRSDENRISVGSFSVNVSFEQAHIEPRRAGERSGIISCPETLLQRDRVVVYA